ncbi:GNAT family N-acetyltransferase [Rhizobium sp. Root483D2]|uniref:GNAT family N-acetyltransferase n=1 Tax=Rhizobium sp. Root483D2 TaxID=1736545 RepID=UPI001FCDAABC|nr:GNAT family N-acetyltransferase [Rhizobium sp. Root483D2]
MRVLAMAKAFHAASEVPFPFSAPMADNVFRSSLDAPDQLCLVLDVDGVALGVLAAEAQPHRFSPVKMAFETMFWIDPEHRGLHARKMLDAYEQWARHRGCAFIHMVGLGGDPLTSRLYERSGYLAVERHFMKPL